MYLRKLTFIAAACAALASCSTKAPEMVSTTADNKWFDVNVEEISADAKADTLNIDLNAKGQTMQGFGTAFSELSYDAISCLSQEDQDAIFDEIFTPGKGASFNICRTPLGASDFARDYYSYDDVDGDFAMEHFSIDRDKTGLLPLIKSALAKNPDMKVWASPWCPPAWLKNNKHYASAATSPVMVAFMSGAKFDGLFDQDQYNPRELMQKIMESNIDVSQYIKPGVIIDNGIKPDQIRHEGEDSFTQDDEYFKAYALYFQKYVEAYKNEGVNIYMVMPQNEPNSAQWYTSCTWTPEGLARFERFLGPAMDEIGVELYHGTMERADPAQPETSLEDSVASKYIKGVSFQWAGKDALPEIHAKYPNLTMVMSEHQCFNGANSWQDCMDSWDLVKHYLDNGVAIYDYWNMALTKGGVSSWGWRQNSLVLVDTENKTYEFDYEYYLMKHLSHYIQPGAVYLGTTGSMDQALAFQNPDGKIVVLVAEKDGEARTLSINCGKKTYTVPVQANSISTIVL